MTKIKICGLKRMNDVEYVNEFKPDFVGFVFAGTKRRIDKRIAAQLKEALDSEIKAVGVFVNEDINVIEDFARCKIIDYVQLHGDEDNDYIASLKTRISLPIIKAVRVKNEDSIIKAKNLRSDYLLLDTYTPGQYGGTGESFNRNLIPKDIGEFFLAGGLGAHNIVQAVNECEPFAVDLSSSVETDGFKDREKIKQIIDIVRNI